jgi:hypothetical protein
MDSLREGWMDEKNAGLKGDAGMLRPICRLTEVVLLPIQRLHV